MSTIVKWGRLCVFLFVGLVWAGPAHAQTGSIEGQVTDAETGEPLPGVNLRVEESTRGVATDSAGVFVLRDLQAGRYPIVVSFVGYETTRREVRVRSGQTTRLDVRLSRRSAALSEIVVVGSSAAYGLDQTVTATKVPTEVMNAPQSVAAVSEQVIEDQQAFTLQRALENVSGIGTTDGFGQTLDGFRLRGFFSRDVYIDGIPETGANPIKQDMATVERIDVLKGPASVLFGRAEPGGLVNIVTKEPLRRPSYGVAFTGGSDMFRGTVDLTGPLTSDGSVRYRLIGAVERNESFRDFIDGDTQVLAPSLAVDFTDRIGLTVDLEYNRDTTPIDRGIPAIDGRPSSVDRAFSMSGPQQDRKAEEARGRYEFRFDATEHLTLYQRTRIAYSDNEFVNVQPSGVEGNELVRSANKNDNEEDTYLVQLEGVYDRSFLGTDHTILGGAEYRLDDFQFEFRLDDVPNLNIDNPDFGFEPDFPEERSGGGNFPTETYSLYLQDQVEVTKSLTVLAGGRVDWSEVKSFFESGGNVVSDQETNSMEFSPRVGLLYRPVEQVSLFGNFTESFSPQNGRNAEGEPFDPQEGRQWEGGVKLQSQGGRLQATLAYFNIEKRNVPVADPTADAQGASILIGEQTSEGVEVDVTGTITDGWQIVANYSYKDAEISRDTNEEIVGNRLPNVAENRGRLWSTYRFRKGLLHGFRVGAGLTSVGGRFANRQNTVKLSRYNRVDVSVGYAPPRLSSVEAIIRVENLNDEEYFTSGVGFGANNIQVGDPLSVTATLRINL